jgi:pilus assembly protein CpaC
MPQRMPAFCAALLLMLGLLMPAAAWAAETIALLPGAQRMVTLPSPITRIVIGEAGIIDASVQNDRNVQLVALKPGRTNMTVFTIAATEGTAYVINVAGPVAARSTPVPATRTTSSNGIVIENGVATGTAPNVLAHAQAVAGGGEALVDRSLVGGGQMVAVEIRFAAVSTNTLKEIGFNFQSLGRGLQIATQAPNTVTGALSNSFQQGAPSGIQLQNTLPLTSAFNLLLGSPQSNILTALSALNSAGLTQLLAEPTLLVRSGDTASFLAGGEVPIPVPQGGSSNTVTIEYHKYGVKLDIAPTVLSSDRIVLKVAPEVSEIDNANGVSLQGFTVPAFRTRTTSTTVELGDGQSFVLAGLIYSNSAITESKFPWLGSIPILGVFFKTTQNARQRQELIIVATPRLVRPLSPGQIPPLPGHDTIGYDPSIGDVVLNRKPLDETIANYGLMK